MREATEATEVLDETELLERVDHDLELLGELVALFLDDHPRQMESVRQAIDEQDFQGLERSAHTLKGVVGNLAGKRAFDAARQLEALGREGDLNNAMIVWRELDDELKALEQALQSLQSR